MAGANLAVMARDGTAAPIEGATVVLSGPANCRSQATTNAQGLAEFSNITSGIYKVTVSHRDYRETSIITEVRPMTSNVTNVVIHISRHVYFAIYYKTGDDAFKRAADTWKSEVMKRISYKTTLDTVLMREVKTEVDFRKAWSEIAIESKLPGRLLFEGRLFTHASKGSDQDGLEFMRDSKSDGTITRTEIPSFEKLNWTAFGKLVLHGCNTGLDGNRGWTPAAEFAKSQGVETLGQTGYAYFSTGQDTYFETDGTSAMMYLWAYRRGKNATFGAGQAMEPKKF